MKCTLVSNVVPQFPDQASGPVRIQTYCSTHCVTLDMLTSGGPPYVNQCPIGYLEDKIEALEARIDQHEQDWYNAQPKRGDPR